jgi:hypothetical protein
MEWSEVKSKRFTVLSAIAGTTAVRAMGALTVTFSDVSGAETPEPTPPVTPPITTTPSTIPPTAEQH